MMADQAITIANDDTLSAFVRQAQRRVLVLAPAVSSRLAAAITETWVRLGASAVSVVLDVEPEVYRLGYGEYEALAHLESVAARLGTTLNRQPGIRIGLVISDEDTIVFSPTPLLIEAGPTRQDNPNAIRLGKPPASMERDVGQGPNGIRDQVVGLDKAEKANIQRVQESLAQNPPQKFDVSRRVRVFNAAFEFVDFELSGTFIDRKTVPHTQAPLWHCRRSHAGATAHVVSHSSAQPQSLGGASAEGQGTDYQEVFARHQRLWERGAPLSQSGLRERGS